MSREDVEELMNFAFEALGSGELKEAMRLGKRLQKLGHTSGYEILARAHWEDGNRKKAIRLLQEGVRKAPSVMILWHCLGCYQSDLENYDEAIRCLTRAIELSDDFRSGAILNLAIAYNRKGECEKALQTIRSAVLEESGHDSLVPFYECEANILLCLDRFEEMLDVVERALAQFHAEGQHQDLERRIGGSQNAAGLQSQLFAMAGVGTLETGGALEEVDELVRQSLALNQCNTLAMELLRRAHPATDPAARKWTLTIMGQFHRPVANSTKPPGFLVGLSAVAISPEDALARSLLLFPPESRDSLSIEKSLDNGPAEGMLLGSYHRLGYIFLHDKADFPDGI